MSFRSIIVLLLAGVCGVAAVVAVLNSIGATATKAPDTIQVVVASVEIHRGETIDSKMVRMVDWPKGLVPGGTLLKVEDALDRTALTGILKDEPLLKQKVASGSGGNGLAPLIEDGMRAFTILTPSDATGVAGFILPGNRVDVVLAVSGNSNDVATGGGTATTLLQNIEVLAVGRLLEAPRENKVESKGVRSVTLSVTPDQAAKLGLAQSKGQLLLSLRGNADSNTAPVNTVTLRDLRFQQMGANPSPVNESEAEEPAPAPEPPPVPAPAPIHQIRVLRGSASGTIVVTGVRDESRP